MSDLSCPWCGQAVTPWGDYVLHVATAHPNGDPDLAVTTEEERA